MIDYRETLARLLVEAGRSIGIELRLEDLLPTFSEPPKPELGDLAFPCFQLARSLRKAPPAIAAELAAALAPLAAQHPAFGAVTPTGPYINVALDRTWRVRSLLADAARPDYGHQNLGHGRTIGIDYSAPNIAKPFGIGHLRSTGIGNALKNIFSSLGYRVVGINHLGDWGTQFGKLMAAWEEWGDEQALLDNPIQHLYDLYVRFHRRAEADEAFNELGRAWFRRLEEGDPRARAYWERFRELSLREFQRVYVRLNVSFDHYWGEAFYNDLLEPLLLDLEKAGLTEESEGALVVPMDDPDMPPCLVRKSDGATLYATRDLAAARFRWEQVGFERFLYVVGAAQSVHFRQVFRVLQRMGYDWADRLVHVPFGMILGISTRKGTLVFLEDVLDQGRALARERIEDREYLTDADKETISEQIAMGAVLFYDLSRSRMKDYEFNWDEILKGLRPGESGRTGPYLQYTHVRLAAVEAGFRERFGELPSIDDIDASLLVEPQAIAVVALLEKFPETIRDAADTYEPAVVARYLLDLAEAFNAFYSAGIRVVGDDPALSAVRVALVTAVRNTLANGLSMLGVPRPERM